MKNILNKLIWGIIGFIICLVFTPLLNPFVTKIYLKTGLKKGPTLHVKIFKNPPIYKENTIVDGVQWKKTFRQYGLIVQNKKTSNITLDHIILQVDFPGAIVKITKDQNSDKDSRLYANKSIEIRRKEKLIEDVETSRLVVECKSLIPGGAILATVIIDHQIKDDGYYFMFNPTNNYFCDYNFSVNGVPLKRNLKGRIYGNDEEAKTVFIKYGIYIRKYGDIRSIESSINWFDRCLAQEQDNKLAKFHKGISLGMIGKKDNDIKKIKKSFELFKEVTSIDQDYKKAWYNLGVTKQLIARHEFNLKNYRNAKDECIDGLIYFEKAIKIDPNYQVSIEGRKMMKDALDFLNKILKSDEAPKSIMISDFFNSKISH